MNRQLELELLDISNSPLDMKDLERFEIEALDAMMFRSGPERDRARMMLQMTAEIRKARGKLHDLALTDSEIDEEIAHVRRLS